MSGAKLDAGILRREKATVPHAVRQRLRVTDALRDHHDEGGEIFVLTAKTIGNPRTDAGASGKLKPGLAKRDSRIMIDLLGLNRFDDGEVVDRFGGMRQQFAEPCARFSVLRELK